MTKVKEQILAANQEHVRRCKNRPPLPKSLAKSAAILTCMDHRIDPAQFAGIVEGDAHVIRNAGGRASDDAIRSLVVSHKLIGTTEWFVIHHTACAMATITDQTIATLLAETLDPAVNKDGVWCNEHAGVGSNEGHYREWLTIRDMHGCVRQNVQRIAKHPLVSKKISIYGYIYNVDDGSLTEVEGATRLGS